MLASLFVSSVAQKCYSLIFNYGLIICNMLSRPDIFGCRHPLSVFAQLGDQLVQPDPKLVLARGAPSTLRPCICRGAARINVNYR